MIKILKMTQDGFNHYMLSAIKNYANEKVNNGTWESKDALSNSKKQYALLLPDGLQTANHYFYSIFNKEEKIGYIWLAKDDENKQSAFIYDFEIYEEFQNLGFGSKTLDLVADKAKELGFSFWDSTFLEVILELCMSIKKWDSKLPISICEKNYEYPLHFWLPFVNAASSP